MSQLLVSSLSVVVFLVVSGMLVVNFYYVVQPFLSKRNGDTWEGVARFALVAAGYMIYLLAEVMQSGMEGVIVHTFLKGLTAALPWDVVWVIATLFGVLSGFFYGSLIKGGFSKSFRWVLFLLALTHGVFVDLALAFYGFAGTRTSEEVAPLVSFVVGLLLTLGYVLPSHRKEEGSMSDFNRPRPTRDREGNADPQDPAESSKDSESGDGPAFFAF